MRSERRWALPLCCLLSLGIHVGLGLRSRGFSAPLPPPAPTEIEVSLEPLPEAAVKAAAAKPSSPPPPAEPPRLPARVGRAGAKGKGRNGDGGSGKVAGRSGREAIPDAAPGPRGLPKPAQAALSSGGGSPAPSVVLGGRGGAPGPKKPLEDILFTGGGAGGMNLPKAAPRMGGGGGQVALAVPNSQAPETVHENKAGVGPGTQGGQGTGEGGGVGFQAGKGVGTRLEGKEEKATLQSAPGEGLGAGQGSNIGTQAPGGGKGTGSELPGTGGTGQGYGRGSGDGVGNGSGNAGSGGGGAAGGGSGDGGRGGVFGAKTVPAANDGRMRIVYVLDISFSMEELKKLPKAKAALRRALSELKPFDAFNIITFDQDTHPYAPEMLTASKDNVRRADDFVKRIKSGDGTNLYAALEFALGLEGVTHVVVLSDGEPNMGIKASPMSSFCRTASRIWVSRTRTRYARGCVSVTRAKRRY